MRCKKKIRFAKPSHIVYNTNKVYRLISENEQLCKPIIESREVDMEKLKKSLLEIENAYYSSNIKFERIRERKTVDIIRDRLPIFLKSHKQNPSKY